MSDYIWPEISKDTPIEELKRIHKMIWDCAIENEGRKPDAPYISRCVACSYSALITTDDNWWRRCNNCPIKWPGRERCSHVGSLYDAYCNTRRIYDEHPNEENHNRLIELCEAIRDIEWKDS